MLNGMSSLPEFFPRITGFQWDDGNSEKNWKRHKVSRAEAEQVFLNRPLFLADDRRHSAAEPRYFALGRSDDHRLLAAVFTLRGPALRVISVRPMSRRERKFYAQAKRAEEDSTL
jgi:uncharacterized DUF497 family protein